VAWRHSLQPDNALFALHSDGGQSFARFLHLPLYFGLVVTVWVWFDIWFIVSNVAKIGRIALERHHRPSEIS
jgi:hypothetical protein